LLSLSKAVVKDKWKKNCKKFVTSENFFNFVAVMNTKSFFRRAFDLYYDGFRSMTLGRTLWLIIGIKLFIMFAILKVFFFPNFLKQNAGHGHEAEFVAEELQKRQQTPPLSAPSSEEVIDNLEITNP